MRSRRQRHNEKKSKIKLTLLMICIFFTICIAALFMLNHSTNKNNLETEITEEKQKVRSYDKINQDVAYDIHSSNAILISLDDNEILLDKSGDERVYPASLTKIMTAIVAIENLPNLNQKIHLEKDMFDELYTQGASMAGFLPNESVEAIDLIYGVLLPSGAESCIGLANEISDSEKDYVRLMNEKAQELGMKNTHFTNSTGLHNERHYSTVSDIAILLEYALQDDTFREIYTSKSHTAQGTNLQPDGVTLQSTMFKHMDTDELNNGTIEGGKTGYTQEAKLCLASLANIDGKEYILVTANADGSPQTEQFNILDAFTVYNQISDSSDY
ncbi:D-alanyl-D-alanine carboxypeptidase VanY [Gottschalkia acidurici 9a]|uniref:D-alanyl-D-alanine carboxypeptidase VanY n=1 Tax=Gottschalkia acidurici (strain ATCC 7906 / DSM 604 / BCRC 14475 / CIP 104303 / KCTC 5404 / NCIMB 10678 / 9a) TaxID=1128398 RepID=K0B307_GOTA9|nr:D-alanyl-D-alanine carboxypeptidase [Gottschalkia acidurici]AFS79016.1 D-alanyl-D-alanine carboxypeptidase VanY [Gottschalkia acidurici 9a]